MESFTIFENHAYGPYKDLTFAKNLVNLAPKLMQHVIAFGSLSTRLTIARNFVHLAQKLVQHVICSVCLQKWAIRIICFEAKFEGNP